jgi:hypothetical protein
LARDSRELQQRASWIARRIVSVLRPAQIARQREIRRALGSGALHFGRSWPSRLAAATRSVLEARPGTGEIWAVGLARNEADIIEETVRVLIAQGVDPVVVLDHHSDDDTAAILRRLGAELPVTVLDDPIPQFWQGEKTTRLARAAAAAGASWVVPFDADELWFGDPGRTLAETLRSLEGNVARAAWFHYQPVDPDDAASYAERFPYRAAMPSPNPKVAFRANWLVHVDPGNHRVFTACPQVVDALRIAHYSVRTPEQILRKARDGAAAIRAEGGSLDGAPRWRELDGADAAAAESYVDRLRHEHDLVFDPAARWE